MININAAKVADILGGELIGNPNVQLSGLNNLEYATENDITFYSDTKYESYFLSSKAGCIITILDISKQPSDNQAFVLVNNPHYSFTLLLDYINSLKARFNPGIHPSAVIEDSASIHPESFIGANVYIGNNTKIEKGCMIKPNSTIYENVFIGENTLIHANVSIYEGVIIGSNCTVHSGAVLGSDGFGYNENKQTGEFTKIPQLGSVLIEDNVEIGACTTIDRAMLGNTIIRKGTKIDNLVHIAHNCEIGENTAFAAQTGVSGTVKVGKRNRFGGQVGVAGHLNTADDVIVMAKSGLSKSIEKAGIYFGAPAKERLTAFKIEAAIRHLPEIYSFVEKMKKREENS
jgi:UDP-3-O-[3-hydroxymyristoyl] glucosamine N-acyltransferase